MSSTKFKDVYDTLIQSRYWKELNVSFDKDAIEEALLIADKSIHNSMDYNELQKVIEETKALMQPDKQRIVCAACRWPDGHVILGIRHGSPDMHLSAMKQGYKLIDRVEEGFVDQWGNFIGRNDAYVIAERQGQYRPWGHHTPGRLYSEDLY